MGDPFHGKTLPRAALAGAAALVAAAILASGTARLTGIGTTRLPAAEQVTSAELRFLDREDGAVLVQRYPDQTLIAVLPPARTASCAACCAAWRANAGWRTSAPGRRSASCAGATADCRSRTRRRIASSRSRPSGPPMPRSSPTCSFRRRTRPP